jgi:hypothetical protein
MGPTVEAEKSFEQFIASRGYQIAPVTMDAADWVFRVAYANAVTSGDRELRRRVSDEYLKYADLNINFAEEQSASLFGHQIKQIMLLHANELNADNLTALAGIFKKRGYQFITVADALKDPAYQFPDKYVPTSNWLSLWAFNQGKQFKGPKIPEFVQKIYDEDQKK